MAEAAGHPEIDSGGHEGKRQTAFCLAAWDEHPSLLGHEDLTDWLYQEFAKQACPAERGVAELAL